MNAEDEVQIQQAITETIAEKENGTGISLFNLFKENHFVYFAEQDADCYSIISQLCLPIVTEGLEKDDFIQRVIDRESVSPTS